MSTPQGSVPSKIRERNYGKKENHCYRMRSKIERKWLPTSDYKYLIKKILRETSPPEFKCPAPSKVPKRFAV